jgi:serine/threonine protein phosphatase 1
MLATIFAPLRDQISRDQGSGDAPARGARAPDGKRIYVVGDIHGRNDLLVRIHEAICVDIRKRPTSLKPIVVYLGDYVDRGPGSSAVLNTLIRTPLKGMKSVYLKGNHEDMMLRFLHGDSVPHWLHNGGDATLASYGIEASWMMSDASTMEALRRRLQDAMPPEHVTFLESLRLFYVAGDYLFVHAGIRPGVPLDAQRPADLLWIRDPFLMSKNAFGKCVVHGHTICPVPEVRTNRIGIDTGAFYSGRLTCLVLEGDRVGFLHT